MPVDVFRLANSHGIELHAMTLGCIIVSLFTPDRHGVGENIVLGYDELAPYTTQSAYFGAIIGRHANRIAHARFTLDGRTYELSANEGPHHLHGGHAGFDRQVWHAAELISPHGSGVTFTRTSPDGEEGYPGTLDVSVRYLLTDTNELHITYEATTSATTVVNLTQHTYFNLSGNAAETVLAHELRVQADAYVPVDREGIPTGIIAPVQGTPFDFRRPSPIGARIAAPDAQLHAAGGYDHTLVVRRTGAGLVTAAALRDPHSGRTLEIRTTEPGIQVYSGNKLDGATPGGSGLRHRQHAGICLETQHFPDGPNRPHFPSPVLRPHVPFRSSTVIRFGTDARS